MVHLLLLLELFVPLTERATRAASVNASLTPRFFFAEHSRTESACKFIDEYAGALWCCCGRVWLTYQGTVKHVSFAQLQFLAHSRSMAFRGLRVSPPHHRLRRQRLLLDRISERREQASRLGNFPQSLRPISIRRFRGSLSSRPMTHEVVSAHVCCKSENLVEAKRNAYTKAEHYRVCIVVW